MSSKKKLFDKLIMTDNMFFEIVYHCMILKFMSHPVVQHHLMFPLFPYLTKTKIFPYQKRENIKENENFILLFKFPKNMFFVIL